EAVPADVRPGGAAYAQSHASDDRELSRTGGMRADRPIPSLVNDRGGIVPGRGADGPRVRSGTDATKGGRMSYDLSGPVRLAVIYYSATGTVYELAKAAGLAAEKAGAEVRLRKVREMAPPDVIAANRMWSEHVQATRHIAEATLDDLDWADAIMLGAPTR